MRNIKYTFLTKIFIATFVTLCVGIVFLYEMKVNLIHDSIRNFILIKDMTSIKYVLTPLLKGDLNHISVTENDSVILDINDGESLFKKIEYRRNFNINNNTIDIGFTPYYFYIGFAIQCLFTYLIYSIYSLKLDRDLILKKNYDLSQKLAHDIRSPISTLNLISSKISDPDIQFLQLAVVDQINAIANDLLNESNSGQTAINTNFGEKSAQNTQSSTPKNQNTNINFLLKTLKNLEKEYQFKSNVISQKIIFEIDSNHIESTAESKIPTEKLCSIIYNCLNNFIQNSIEATRPDGIIKIRTAKNSKGQTEIIVSDNGNGIPDSILHKLGNEVISYGKSKANFSGNGIALLNAKRDLLNAGIELKINSILNTGTEITLALPIVSPK